ncbi:MAG: PaaI family thioesterase [Prolixibacteraceae bacterium]
MDFSDLTINTPVEYINEALQNSLIGNLHIKIEQIAEGEVIASMPVCWQTSRPGGMLHGGSSLAMAETIAGLGTMLLIDLKAFDVRGMQVSASHTGSIKEGNVRATAKIIHQGNKTHIWNVDLRGNDGRLISTARVTNIIVKKND